MKKIVSFVLALALLLACTVALAEKPVAVDNGKKAAGKYLNDWKPNFDGTHTQKNKVTGKRTTVACDYEIATYGNTTVKACPVCGDFNGEKVALCTSRYLTIERLWDAAKASKYHVTANDVAGGRGYEFLTNGQYMVRILKMPEESDVAYAVTFCHEIAGKQYDAECPYSVTLPLDGNGLTVKKAYFGGARDIKAEVKVTNTGLYLKPYATEDAFGLFLLVK